MSKFYFIPTTYEPNTAATNRSLAYIKGFSELGIKPTVVFLGLILRKVKLSKDSLVFVLSIIGIDYIQI